MALVLAGAGCVPAANSGAPPAGDAPATAPTPPAAASQRPKRGGEFHQGGSGNWPHLDPHLVAPNASVVAGTFCVCYSRLLRYKLSGVKLPATVPVGDLAESWEQADDVTFLFRLRPNVTWQNIRPVNGRPLVAQDIVYSYERQRTPGYPNAALLEGVAKLEAVDPSTLKIVLDHPAADFLVNIAAPQSVIVAREAVEVRGDLKEGPFIGTGPFLLDRVVPDGTTVARRNPDYYIPGQPYLDAFTYTVVPDAESTKAAFRARQVDLLSASSVSKEEVEAIRRTIPDILVENVRGLGSATELGLKLDRPPFTDQRVRRAIYKAIDPRQIIDAAWGSGWLSVGLILPAPDWAIPEEEMARLYRRDLEGARQLLREAGFDSGLDFTISVARQSNSAELAGEVIAAQLAEADIRAKLKVVDAATYATQVQDRKDFEAYIGAGGVPASTDAALFGKYHSLGARNITGVSDPKLDDLIERQTLLGRDPERRKKLLLEVQHYLIDQAYVHAFHTFEGPAVFQPYVRDFHPSFGPVNLETYRMAQVWLDK
jgi:peptide/nickel transport system substrate-binding protein